MNCFYDVRSFFNSIILNGCLWYCYSRNPFIVIWVMFRLRARPKPGNNVVSFFKLSTFFLKGPRRPNYSRGKVGITLTFHLLLSEVFCAPEGGLGGGGEEAPEGWEAIRTGGFLGLGAGLFLCVRLSKPSGKVERPPCTRPLKGSPIMVLVLRCVGLLPVKVPPPTPHLCFSRGRDWNQPASGTETQPFSIRTCRRCIETHAILALACHSSTWVTILPLPQELCLSFLHILSW